MSVSGFYFTVVSMSHLSWTYYNETTVAAARKFEFILIAKCFIAEIDNPDYNKWAIQTAVIYVL